MSATYEDCIPFSLKDIFLGQCFFLYPRKRVNSLLYNQNCNAIYWYRSCGPITKDFKAFWGECGWLRQAEGFPPCPWHWKGFEAEAFRLPPRPPREVSGWPGQQWGRLLRPRQGREAVGEQLVPLEVRGGEVVPGKLTTEKARGGKKAIQRHWVGSRA